MTRRRTPLFRAAVCAVLALSVAGPAGAAVPSYTRPAIGHVWTIVLENHEMLHTFGPLGQVEWPYLARTLPSQGVFIPNYFGIGHSSLDNYIGMVSGQGPNLQTQTDCEDATTLGSSSGITRDGDGQAIGSAGCTYPAEVHSIADQLDAAGYTWKGYMEDMDASATQRTSCRGPFTASNVAGETYPAEPPSYPAFGDRYRAKHDPFVYFHSIFDNLANCDAHVVPTGTYPSFGYLASDLTSVATTPNYSFITPDQCSDAHDTCGGINDQGAGLVSDQQADAWLQKIIPLIEDAPAYQKDGLIVIIFDEGVAPISCCGEKNAPNLPSGHGNGDSGINTFGLGQLATGGGQTGAIAISRFIAPGTVSAESYNHYSYLKSMEDIFGLSYLGYAGQAGLQAFGSDIYNGTAVSLP